MGSQNSTASWTTDDWAFGTGQNAVPIDAMIEETTKIPAKYFGGKAIGNDPSMNQMQNDLLSFDDTIKNLFRRKKNKKRSRNVPPTPYEYEYTNPAAVRPTGNSDYLAPIFDGNSPPVSTEITDDFNHADFQSDTAIWRCGNCNMENKIGEHTCRQCRQAETRL